jgi:hypothetical protein
VSVLRKIGQEVAIIRCARKRGERSGGKGGAWPHLRCRFRAETLQMRRIPARNFTGLAASRAGGRKGDGGGVLGLLIGVARGRNGRAINRELKRRNYRGETVAGVKFGPGRKTTPC